MMYQRYAPNTMQRTVRQRKPPAGECGSFQTKASSSHRTPPSAPAMRTASSSLKPSPAHGSVHTSKTASAKQPLSGEKKTASAHHPLLDLLPPAIYNPKTKKVLGLFSAEDLLLAALILLLLDNDQECDTALVYVLFYLLLSDYVTLPFSF